MIEEEEEQKREALMRSPSLCSSTSSSELERKVPDQSHSQNVFTEHLDFMLARQQWRKMEEETKGQPFPQPGVRGQGSGACHNSLYPPVRSPRLGSRQHQQLHSLQTHLAQLPPTLSPGSEDSGLDEASIRASWEEPETAVEREIRVTLDREERHRRERGRLEASLKGEGVNWQPRPPTFSLSPSPPNRGPVYHEMAANNVIILEPDSHPGSRPRLLSPSIFSDWPSSDSSNVIILETTNVIIRSASEFCLSSAPSTTETQQSTFSTNPFFKLRSLSSQSLVEQEIRMVRQREEEWRRQREEEWRRRRDEEWKRGREQGWMRGGERERYDTVLVSPALNDSLSFQSATKVLPDNQSSVPEVPDRSVSSPSSPSRTRKLDRSSLSCDHKFPSSLSSLPRRQNAMAQRWEAGLITNQQQD
ncbi:uncharacterized protein FYW47_016945 [Aplochiton taeniatus]